jgi:hypothetical protein
MKLTRWVGAIAATLHKRAAQTRFPAVLLCRYTQTPIVVSIGESFFALQGALEAVMMCVPKYSVTFMRSEICLGSGCSRHPCESQTREFCFVKVTYNKVDT